MNAKVDIAFGASWLPGDTDTLIDNGEVDYCQCQVTETDPGQNYDMTESQVYRLHMGQVDLDIKMDEQ